MELSVRSDVWKVMPIRRVAGCLLAAFTLVACGGVPATSSPEVSQTPGLLAQNPCSGYTCAGPGAQLNVVYPYRLSTHCGVLGTRFDGRSFYVEAVDPSTVTTGLQNPEDWGTMTLVTVHLVIFRSSAGHVTVSYTHLTLPTKA